MNKNMLTLLFLMMCCAGYFTLITCEIAPKVYANILVTVTYPDSTANGKKAVLEINSNTSKTPIILQGKIAENTATFEAEVTGEKYDGQNSDAYITAYLIGEPEDEDIDVQTFNSIPTVLATGYYTYNNKNYGNIQSMVHQSFTLQEGSRQIFFIEFPERQDIQIEYTTQPKYNFEEYGPPKISWNQYPGTVKGYDIAILVYDKNWDYPFDPHIANTKWLCAYSANNLENTFVDVNSNYFSFKEKYEVILEESGAYETIIGPSIVPGDIFKIELSVFIKKPDKPYLNSFMDSITIKYKE